MSNDKRWLIPSSAEELLRVVQSVIAGAKSRPGRKRVIIYTRVSVVDPRRPGYSIEVQLDQVREFVEAKGWEVVAIYSDPDRSGRNSRRPGLQQAIRDIKAGKADAIAVPYLDRLYRNLASLLRFIGLLRRYNADLISLAEQIDTDTPWGRLVLYIMGGIAEMYVWATSERTRAAKARRVGQGLSNASCCFGYCNGLCSECADPNGPGYCPLVGSPDRSKGRIPVPHPVESQAARLAAVLYSQGMSNSDIADYLNSHDFSLPDGQVVHFRTKGRPGLFPPGPFTRDSIRDIVRNPFYAGLVARYPSRPLDMEDDPEHPDRHSSDAKTPGNRRTPIELVPGKHQALYSVELWKHNQQLRENKSFTPTSHDRPRREYLLTGVGRCWVCAQYDGREANLRGVTGGPKGREYYRCATIHSNYKLRGKKSADEFETSLATVGLAAQPNGDRLVDLHTKSSLRSDVMTAQVNAILSHLVIPESWCKLIMAYYLSDDGMSHFERESYNLRQQLARYQELYERGHLTLAQFEQRTAGIVRQLQQLEPEAQPEAAAIIPLLQDFPALWVKLSTGGQRGLLKVMFAGLYFDADSRLRRALAHEPFKELLGLPENGILL